jgi:hypothetical protein
VCELRRRGAALDLRLEQPALEEARRQPLDRLQVVRTKHPAEVVMQLQVGGRARRLVHGADDVGTLERRHPQEAVENVREAGHVVQVVQDDDGRQLAHGVALALLGDVGQVLLQLLAAVVVHAEELNKRRIISEKEIKSKPNVSQSFQKMNQSPPDIYI